MNKILLVVGLVVLIVIVVAIGPLALIWAINEFGQYLWPERVLPYTIWTWLASAVFLAAVSPSVKVAKK